MNFYKKCIFIMFRMDFKNSKKNTIIQKVEKI